MAPKKIADREKKRFFFFPKRTGLPHSGRARAQAAAALCTLLLLRAGRARSLPAPPKKSESDERDLSEKRWLLKVRPSTKRQNFSSHSSLSLCLRKALALPLSLSLSFSRTRWRAALDSRAPLGGESLSLSSLAGRRREEGCLFLSRLKFISAATQHRSLCPLLSLQKKNKQTGASRCGQTSRRCVALRVC